MPNFQIRLSSEDDRILTETMKLRDLKKASVIRSAVRLLYLVTKAQKEGNELVIRGHNTEKVIHFL